MTIYYGVSRHYRGKGVPFMRATWKWKIMVFVANLLTPDWIPLRIQVIWSLLLLNIFGFAETHRK